MRHLLGLARQLVPRRLRPWAARMLRRFVRLEVRVSDDLGIRFENRSDWCAFEETFARGLYDRAIRLALSSWGDSTPFVALDLGANVGMFALRMMGEFDKSGAPAHQLVLTCVEGSPSTWKRLEGHLQVWREHFPRLVGQHGLAGRRSGAARISQDWSHMSRSIATANSSSPKVAYLNLDSLVPEDCPISILKCDIEGAEYEFLENYPDLLRRTRVVAIEFHGDREQRRLGAETLEKAGFSCINSNERLDSEGSLASLDTFARSGAQSASSTGGGLVRGRPTMVS